MLTLYDFSIDYVLTPCVVDATNEVLGSGTHTLVF